VLNYAHISERMKVLRLKLAGILRCATSRLNGPEIHYNLMLAISSIKLNSAFILPPLGESVSVSSPPPVQPVGL